jgi:hypothetical protein
MAATAECDPRWAGNWPSNGTFPAAANELICEGWIVCVNADGEAVEGIAGETFNAAGKAKSTFDNRTSAPEGGAAGAIDVEVAYGVFGCKINGTEPIPGQTVFVYDNETITLTPGTNGTAGSVVEVRDSIAYVYFGPQIIGLLAVAAVEAAKTAQLIIDVDAAEVRLDDLEANATTAQACLPIPLTSALNIATGAALAVFADGASTTPGTQFTDSKTAAVRWNNHATPGAIAVNVPYPSDLDDAANVVFHALVSKVGATVGDATKLTVGAYEIVPAALHDADDDFGGDTSAVVGDAVSKTVTEVTLTLALANVHAFPAGLCLTIKPKAGTLGTDDLVLHAAWLEYTRAVLAA